MPSRQNLINSVSTVSPQSNIVFFLAHSDYGGTNAAISFGSNLKNLKKSALMKVVGIKGNKALNAEEVDRLLLIFDDIIYLEDGGFDLGAYASVANRYIDSNMLCFNTSTTQVSEAFIDSAFICCKIWIVD